MRKLEDLSLAEQIRNLSELDLAELLEDLADHLCKNKMTHLIRTMQNEELYSMNELEERIKELEDELESAEGKLEDIRMIL